MFVLLLAYPAFASASFGIKLEGDRSSIIRNVSAGSAINETIIIENPDAETTINLFPVDQFKSADGTYIPKSKYEKTSLFGEWVGPPVILTLAAQTAYAYAFTISVPKDAVNGIYYGAIMLQEVPKTATKGTVKITSGVGMRIKITVTGGLTSPKINTKQTLVEDVAPVVTPILTPVQGAVQTKQALPPNPPELSPQPKNIYSQPAPLDAVMYPTPSSLIPENSPSLTPIRAMPHVIASEDQPSADAPVSQGDSSTKKHDTWGIVRIFVLAAALLFVLFLIVRKT